MQSGWLRQRAEFFDLAHEYGQLLLRDWLQDPGPCFLGEKIMLFSGLGRSALGKTVPSVL